MYHPKSSIAALCGSFQAACIAKKMPPVIKAAFLRQCLLVLVLALLVGNTAAGLAGRLAGGLALAAAAVLGAGAQIAGLNGLNSFHGRTLQSYT
jgi:hypothetical protein